MVLLDVLAEVQWRCGFYVAGDDAALGNFMCLLDSFISFKSHQLAKDVEVHIHPHSSVEEIVSEDSLELECLQNTFRWLLGGLG